ncbi:MAG: hypothetical protein AMXMBFR16_10900 [Candidatus Uhrbacteria bacterium]
MRNLAIGKRPFNPGNRRPPNRLQNEAYVLRAQKRAMKAGGLIHDKIPSIWNWSYGTNHGVETALTLSEAKAKIKAVLQLPAKARLPKEVKIERINHDPRSSGASAGTVRLFG